MVELCFENLDIYTDGKCSWEATLQPFFVLIKITLNLMSTTDIRLQLNDALQDA